MKMKKIVVNKQLLPMKAHYFFWNAGTGPVVPYLSSYARQLGFSSVTVGFIYTILPISGMLAKPIFGSIADRFRCQKILFLASQLLTAAAFLSVFYSPKIDIERQVHFSCHEGLPVFDTPLGSLGNCSLEQIQQDTGVDRCKLNCDAKNASVSNILCNYWKLPNFCDKNHPKTFAFNTDVPKSLIDAFNTTIVFRMSNISLLDGTYIQSACPVEPGLSTTCLIDCTDYSINDIIASPTIEDKDTYGLYQFWVFLFLMIIGWIGQAVAVSVGDAICFELLGDRPNRYGYQRLFGSLGWGISSAFAGILIDILSKGKSEKDYTSAFYMAAVFLVTDFFVSSRLQYTQKKISSNILRDVGKLLINIRIIVFLIWCIAVGMCTGLIWQFLFWLVEDLASAQGCDAQNYVKTLEGIIQAVQCLMGEMPFFFLSGWIIKKIGHENTMSLVLLSLGVRLTLYSVITNPWWFLPVELMSGLTFGLFFACMASYASIVAPSGTEATMQGLVGAVFEGIGVSSGSAIAGIVYTKVKGPLTFRYFGFGSLLLFIVHIVIQYLLKAGDSQNEYASPKAALEKVQEDDQQELTYVDS